jgi:hypothetical protein
VEVLSLIAGVLGVLVILAAVIGRFHGGPTMTFPVVGTHTGATVLLVGNTLLLIGIFLLALNLQPKDK